MSPDERGVPARDAVAVDQDVTNACRRARALTTAGNAGSISRVVELDAVAAAPLAFDYARAGLLPP